MTPQERDAAATDRALGLRGSLHDFVYMAWHQVSPSRYVDNWHIGAKCEHLEAVSRGEIRRLVLNEPPGGSKSRVACILWPAWDWIRHPERAWIYGSYSITLAHEHASLTHSLVASDWFQRRWGDRVRVAKNFAAGHYETSGRGWRWSTSVGGPVTGKHCDIQVCDDPTKPLECTEAGLKLAARWWDETMTTRFADPATGRRVIIMQRLDEDDLAGRALAAGYEGFIVPMRYESRGGPRVTSRGIYDPRREEGELLWPARWPEPVVKELETGLGSATAIASQLQQRPVPGDGLVFKENWFRVYIHPPAKFDEMLQSWDFAFKDLEDSDFVVGQLWGRVGANYYLLDQVRGRFDFVNTCRVFLEFTAKWPKATTKLVEDKANGPAVIATLKKKVPGIIPVEPTGSKQARAASVAPFFEAGNVWHPDPAAHRWVEEHQAELKGFPRAKHDDTVDACSQALSHMFLRTSDFSSAMAKLREQGL